MRRRIHGPAAGALTLALAIHALPSRAEDIAVPQAAAYCDDLLRITDIAATKHMFAVIAGKIREGDFLETTLPLAGWEDCSLYGARTYTCDSRGFGSPATAEKALAVLVKEVTACLGEGWVADKSRSSPVYVVVQNAQSDLSMTLSTDATNSDAPVVRLILFVRGRSYENR